MTRSFENKEANTARAESPVPLMVGCTGPSGSGKTYTSLRLATGIQKVVGGDIFVIDTEQRRSLHYADKFKFRHVDFQAPYGSTDYLEALRYVKKQGAGVVVVDSSSHEHTGPGGLLEQHEAELDRMAGNDYAKRDRMTMLAWAKPKKKRTELITAITTELQMPVIFCFRAKTGTKPAPKGSQDKQPIEMGFTSVGADDWLFEMGLNMLFLPGSDGVPTWDSRLPGEKLAIKCPRQFEWVKQEGQIGEGVGQKLAEWAKGASSAVPTAKQKSAPPPEIDTSAFESEVVANVAMESHTAPSLSTWWNAPETVAKRKALHEKEPEAAASAKKLVADRIGELEVGGGV
jgi:hypothetical protein